MVEPELQLRAEHFKPFFGCRKYHTENNLTYDFTNNREKQAAYRGLVLVAYNAAILTGLSVAVAYGLEKLLQ